MVKVFTIKKRKEFLRVAKDGFKMVTSTVILQAAQNFCTDSPVIGYTTTKKIGSAVIRNKSRRRMRAAIRECTDKLLPNTSYVLIGRHNTHDCDFQKLESDLNWGLKKINKLLKGEERLDSKLDFGAEDGKEHKERRPAVSTLAHKNASTGATDRFLSKSN